MHTIINGSYTAGFPRGYRSNAHEARVSRFVVLGLLVDGRRSAKFRAALHLLGAAATVQMIHIY